MPSSNPFDYPNTLFLDLRNEVANAIEESRKEPKYQNDYFGLADHIIHDTTSDSEWDQIFLNMLQPHRESLIKAFLGESESYVRGYPTVSYTDTINALTAYEAVFNKMETDLITDLDHDKSFPIQIRRIVASECAYAFGPSTDWVTVIEDGLLIPVAASAIAAPDKNYCFQTEDGYKLQFQNERHIWTDGDLWYPSMYKNDFGWPVEINGNPIAGILTID